MNRIDPSNNAQIIDNLIGFLNKTTEAISGQQQQLDKIKESIKVIITGMQQTVKLFEDQASKSDQVMRLCAKTQLAQQKSIATIISQLNNSQLGLELPGLSMPELKKLVQLLTKSAEDSLEKKMEGLVLSTSQIKK